MLLVQLAYAQGMGPRIGAKLLHDGAEVSGPAARSQH